MALILAAGVRQAGAQGPLPYEIRCFYGTAAPPVTAGTLPILAAITWHRSNLLKRWVCPVSGYSSDIGGACPNPWGLAGATGTTLIDRGADVTSTQRDRVTSLPEWDMPAAQSDVMWYSYTAGAAFYRALVGVPFNPQTPKPGGVTAYGPTDGPLGQGAQMYLLAAIKIDPTNGLILHQAASPPPDVPVVPAVPDTAPNGDIIPGAGPPGVGLSFRFLVIWPYWPAAPVPASVVTTTGAPTLAAPNNGFWLSDPVQPDVNGIIIYNSTTNPTNPPPPIPMGAYGIGRVYLEWQNPADAAAVPPIWRFNLSPVDNTTTLEPLSAAFFCSRLQVPTTGDSRNLGLGATATEIVGSYLSRVLVAAPGAVPLNAGLPTGAVRDDMYMPGATTVRRSFAIINRDISSSPGRTTMVERLQTTPVQGLESAPGTETVAGQHAGSRENSRPTLPDPALVFGPSSLGGGSLSAGAIDTGHWLQARIPAYQPASEPGDTLGHNPAGNWGYRGIQLLYSDAQATDNQWSINLSANLDQPTTDVVEEFAPFDAQVSVDRQTRLMADASATEAGRVAPGTPWNSPDTTTGNPASLPSVMNPNLPRFAFPGNVALRDSSLVFSNEGNVFVPVTSVGTNQATAQPVGVGLKSRSVGRLLQGNPIWLPIGVNGVYSALTNVPATGLAAGTSGAAGGWGNGGVAGMGNTTYPVALGQGSGQYTSQVVYFEDMVGNQTLYFVDGLTGAVTNTGQTLFDPSRDEPLEPVSYVPTSTRVTESRLPFNDDYAADTQPTLRFDYGAGGVSDAQIYWVSNRTSVARGNGTVDQAAGASSSPPNPSVGPWDASNILYATLTPQSVPGNPNYRPYGWGAQAQNLTAGVDPSNAAAPPVNAFPESFNDLNGKHWTLWDQSLIFGAQQRRTLQYEGSTSTDWAGGGSYIYASGLTKQGLRGFADPGGKGLWLFWTEGDQGKQALHYRWDFTGTPDENEAPVPITNSVRPDWRSDIINDFASGAPMRKPSTSAFVYTKDPAAFLWTPPAGTTGLATQVHVVFSGYTARQQNENICWAAFDQNSMNDPTKNYGKLTFPRVVNNMTLPATNAAGSARAGEQLIGDGLRQTFGSRHLDWLISSSFEKAPVAGVDPTLYLGLFAANSPTPFVYAVNLGQGTYDRARGLYTFMPTVTPINGAPALPAGVQTAAGSGVLANPLAPNGSNNVAVPLSLQIEPSTGTVTFSGALFNGANPSDLGAVFNRNVAGLNNLSNVVLYADYTPFIFRVTNAGAADDSPNAFAETDANDPNQLRLVFLWRRSYTQKDTPSFGRTAFLYKTWTLGTQVAYPPLTGAPTVGGWNGAGWQSLNSGQTQDFTYNPASGIVSMTADGYSGRGGAPAKGVFWLQSAYDGARIQVAYNGGITEQQRIIGWSQEIPAAVDTVQNEGPLRAVPEIYTVTDNNGRNLPAVRYWLIWSSPRTIYDLRLGGNNGSLLHQSSDIYLSTIVPRYGDALREAEVNWQNVQE